MADNNELRQMQMKILDVLIYIDEICRKNNIKYFLSGGTLLGAIRHQGFIPWDDDADVMLDRDDYERLLVCLKKDDNKKFKFGSVETHSNWNKPWARVWDSTTLVEFDSIKDKKIGVFVDVLPLDKVPAGNISFKLYNYRLKFLNSMRNAAMREHFIEGEKHRMIKKFLGGFARRKGAYHFASKVNQISWHRNFQNQGFCGVAVLSHYIDREKFKNSWLNGTVDKEFEGHNFMCPVRYDRYLTQLYGDYMKLPPASKQKSEHVFKLYLNAGEEE